MTVFSGISLVSLVVATSLFFPRNSDSHSSAVWIQDYKVPNLRFVKPYSCGVENGRKYYVARVEHEGGLLPGKAVFDWVLSIWTIDKGQVVQKRWFELLKWSASDFSWTQHNSESELPANAVVTGHSSNGSLPLYSCRVQINQTHLVIGMLEKNTCAIVVDDEVATYDNFELLTNGKPIVELLLGSYMSVDRPSKEQSIFDQSIVNRTSNGQQMDGETMTDQRIVGLSSLRNSTIIKEPMDYQSVDDKPIVYEPSTDQPIIDQPIVNQPIIEQSIIEQPIVNQPIVDQPTIDQPTIDQPTIDQPTIDQPTIDQPIVDQPIINQSIVDQSIVNQPIVDQPIIDQPIINQPIVDQLNITHLIIDQPIIDQPIVNKPMIIHPIIDQLFINQPNLDEPTQRNKPAGKLLEVNAYLLTVATVLLVACLAVVILQLRGRMYCRSRARTWKISNSKTMK